MIRQVASNITKEALISFKNDESKLNDKAASDSKKLMSENISRALRVWYAFVKFIKNQVTVNGRLVDTSLIGLFGKDSYGDIQYMPSPDYLEAGKFKLQRGHGSLVAKLGLPEGLDLVEAYRAKY